MNECCWVSQKFENGCRRVGGRVTCDDTCPWRQTEEERLASLEKARQNYIKRNGCDGYAKAVSEIRKEARCRERD